MVHNGIEYGDMQLICEAYHLLKDVLGVSTDELHEIFTEWNKGELDSYLIEITADIFAQERSGDGQTDGRRHPRRGRPEGHGQMDEPKRARSGRAAVDHHGIGILPLPVRDEGRARRREQGAQRTAERSRSKAIAAAFIEAVRKALFASKICSYAQGFAQMRAASEEYGWNLHYGDIAMIFRGGCIIRARFLQNIKDAYDRDPELKQPAAGRILQGRRRELPRTHGAKWSPTAVARGIPVPAFSLARWRTTTATARSACRRTCCKRSAITSARTRSSAWTKKARSTTNGWSNKSNAA